jgi:hypothetical protein
MDEYYRTGRLIRDTQRRAPQDAFLYFTSDKIAADSPQHPEVDQLVRHLKALAARGALERK